MATRAEVLLHKISLDNADANRKMDAYTAKVQSSETKIKKSGKGMVTSFTAVKASIAALGIGVAVAQLDVLAQRMDRVTQANRGFEQLTRRAGLDNVELLKELKVATRGLLSEQELQIQANNALALGLDLNEQQMGELAAGATKLGRALGLDVNTAMSSLITGIGRQSRMMLDNLGIIVSAEVAQEKYAASLGRSVSSLTDAEKKTAFMNEAVEQLTKSSEALSDGNLTLAESWNKTKTATVDATNALLDYLNTLPSNASAGAGRDLLEQLGIFNDQGALANLAAGRMPGGGAGDPQFRLVRLAQQRLEFLNSLSPPQLGRSGSEGSLLAVSVRDARQEMEKAQAAAEELQKAAADPALRQKLFDTWVVTFREAQAEARALAEIIAPAAGEPGADTSGMEGFGAPGALFPDALDIEASTQAFKTYADQLLVTGNASEIMAMKTQAMADAGFFAAGALIQMGIAGDFSAKALGKAVAEGISRALQALAEEQAVRALAEVALGWAAAARGQGDAAAKHFTAAKFHGAAAALAGAGAIVTGRIAQDSGGGFGGGAGGAADPFETAQPIATPQGGSRNVEIRVFIDGQGFIQDPDSFVREIAGSLEKEMTKAGA